MSKPELGVKRRCLSCAAAFFDLNRSPIACPKCGAAFQIVELAHSRPKWAPSPPVVAKQVSAPIDSIDADAVVPETEDDESTILPIEDEDDNGYTEIVEIDRDDAAPET